MNDCEFVRNSARKAGEILGLADWFEDLDFLRVYKYLHIHCGGDEINMRHWMLTPNKFFENQVPANLITSEKGISDVLDELRFYHYR